tara:strand:+ start:8817 stop:9149 length:333 start_codon:yes stop_codon:yes gene_type:complete
MAWEVALTLSLIGTAFSLFWMGSHLEKDHYALKLLFMFVGLFLLLANLGIGSHIIEANSGTISAALVTSLTMIFDNVYLSVMWVTIFVAFYFMIYFFRQVAMGITWGKRE